MKALILVFLLAGCSTERITPDWYVSQSFNRCAHAVSVMTIKRVKGGNPSIRDAIKFNRGGFLGTWNIRTIQAYLKHSGVKSRLVKTVKPSGQWGIYHVDNAHFVLAKMRDSKVYVVDPISLINGHYQTVDEFFKRVTYGLYVVVDE